MDRDVSNNNTSGDDDLGHERTVQLLPEQHEVSLHSLNLPTTWHNSYTAALHFESILYKNFDPTDFDIWRISADKVIFIEPSGTK